MKRFLLFTSAFLGTALLIFSVIYFPNKESFRTFFDNREALAEGSEWIDRTYSLSGLSLYVRDNPQYVSVVSIVAEQPDSALYFMPDEPRTLGTLSNFFIITGITDLITRGEISSDTMINWNEVERFQLPDVHEHVVNESFNAARDRGWVSNNQISISHALELLAEYKNLALADYFWWLAGEAYWEELSDRLNLTYTEMPLPWSGLYLSVAASIQESGFPALLERWSEDRDQFRQFVIEQSGAFAEDESFRSEVSDILNSKRLGLTFMEERDALALFPQTTAREMASLLLQMHNGELLDPETSSTVLQKMQWPMKYQRGITRNFDQYGALFDNRMGLLNGLDVGTSAYTGDTTVQAVFFDRIPIALWFHMSSNHMHQDFQQRLIFDPAMIERMKRVVEYQYNIPETAPELE